MARVLLAEDDAAVRELAYRALTAEGHAVVAAQDGLEGAECLAAPGAIFDVLLTDIDMPGMDGVALGLKAVAAMPTIRIVLMTAFSDIVAIPDTIKAQVAGILTKPVGLDQLRSAVRGAAA